MTPNTYHVLCFDRDLTVSTSPHPDRQSVPLAWVQTWAHTHSNVDVWATGNQTLTDEARVPGRVTAAAAWDTAYPDQNVVEEHYTGTSYGTSDKPRPTRTDGLEIIDDLYSAIGADHVQFVVVDDIDLAAFADEHDRWTHMYPWSFYNHVTKHGVEPDDEYDYGRVPKPRDTHEFGTNYKNTTVDDNDEVLFHRPRPLDELGVNVWEHPSMYAEAMRSQYTQALGSRD